MKILDKIFNSFESSVESLRLNKILLSNAKKEVIEKSKEYYLIEKQFKESKDYFMKSQMGKPILESMESNFIKQKQGFEKFCLSAEKTQMGLKTQCQGIYKSNPSLRILQEFDDFIPEDKFNSILINLVKGHQEGLIDSSKLLDLKTYKRIDLEKGSVFVKDNRTHYSDVIVINEDNEVLFLVRNKMDNFQPKKYCFPGGHVEQGEDYRYAASRELVEETGINIESTELTDCGIYTDNKIVIHYFVAKVNKEKVNIVLEEKEHEQYEWVKIEDVKKYPLILNLKENLEKVISIPIEFFIDKNPSSVYGFYYINGEFLRKEDEPLAKSLNTIYTAFRIGEISQEIYEKQLKKSHRQTETFNLYKPNGDILYGVRISDVLEKSMPHKYYFREGTPGNYKYYYTRDEYFQAKGKDYIESKPKQDIIGQIESKLEDKINEIIKATEDAEFARTGFHISDYEKEILRLSLLQDMFNSIGTYVEETDELIDFKVNQSLKGNFTIQMSIKRDGQPRYLETDVIYAGGYNIQKLHLRYITNTDLVPKSTPLTNKYKEKITKLTKLQRLEKDVKYYEGVVERYKKEIAEREAMSDEDKALDGGGYDIMKNVTWQELVERGADKNYNYSEQEFIDKREKSRADNIERFNQYTKYIKDSLKSAEKDLAKRIQRVEDFNKTDNIEKSEKIKGGLADGETVEELAAHHKTSIKKIYDEIEIGKKVEMEHTDDPDEALEITMDHLWEIPDYYTRLAKMEKEAKDDIEKGKAAQIGEIRTWSGIKMKKTSEGWFPVKEEKSKTKEDEQTSDKNKETDKKQYSEKELSEFAKQTSEGDLWQAAAGGDEQLRIAAKKELERRNTEENPENKDKPVEKTKEDKGTVLHKKKQLEIILNNNPSPDEIHTWIRKEEDIKTAEEAFNESIESDESTPDFKKEDMENALKEGYVTIYSSYPIKDGVFVTPSKMEAQSYAGKKDVFSKKVNLDDVAWIDGLQGQFAPINKTEETKKEDKESLPSKEKIIEKLRTLPDEQIKRYYNAPYDRVKKAAKFIAEERGLTLEDKFEPLELNDSIEKMDDFINSFDKNLIYQYSFREEESLIKYREDSRSVNNSLRFGGDVDPNIEYIDSVFEKGLFKLNSDIITYRGIGMDNNASFTSFLKSLNAGDVFQDKGFVSTTLSSKVKDDFIPNSDVGKPMYLEIRIRKGHNIIPMSLMGENDARVDMMYGEYEILLNRNSKFKVLESKTEDTDNRGKVGKLIVELI